jgi:hypothetical protein
MRDRAAKILKIVCIGLAGLLLVQLVKIGYRANPLAGVAIPQVPSLPGDTNAVATATNKGPAKPGTNSAAVVMNATNHSQTNLTGVALTGTNTVAHGKVKDNGSNSAPVVIAAEDAATNMAVTNISQTNVAVAASMETNVVSHPASKDVGSNSPPVVMAAAATNSLQTNAAATASMGTNAAVVKVTAGTNTVVGEIGKTNSTNSATAKASGPKKSPTMPPQMMGMMGGPGGKKAPSLSPEIQARVDRVTESEILAPVVHPMPMALLGIAGKVAFLRSPSGQTGMVKEGEDLGEIKLLRIGTNRVLIEQDGQQKELMIFSGLGGESLVSKPTETSDETTKH